MLMQAKRGRSRSAANAAAKERLRRIGVIDVGSNSVRLVVFDGAARSPAYFYNEKVLCGLGVGLGETGRLNETGRRRALAALRRFAALAERMDLSGLIPVATAAVRDARDGEDFCNEVEREAGLQLHVASGEEEARLSAEGVLLGWPSANGLVCDIGGSSAELARVSAGDVSDGTTAPLGPLKLADIKDGEKRARYVRKQVRLLREQVPGPAPRLFLVGGSWRAIARIDMERTGYPLKVLHGYEPPIGQLLKTLDFAQNTSTEELNALTGTSSGRLSLVPLAAGVLSELLKQIEPDRVAISAYGLREGVLLGQMPPAMRALDPLIEVCEAMEAASARAPGFGNALYDWVMPLYGQRPEKDLRLIRAACLLHDINWRAHPDYRAQLCFETVTRANIAGIDHAERIYLAFALLNRSKSGNSTAVADVYADMVPPDRLNDAVVLGKVLRLGAMLSGSSRGVLEHAQLELTAANLILRLDGTGAVFAGEAVERRLKNLATRLGRTGVVLIDP